MSANRLVFEGLDELRQQLRALPADLVSRASAIIDRRAQNAAAAIRAAYPEGETGNLRSGVSVPFSASSAFGAGALVSSRSQHAHLWEFGTAVRRTARGANRARCSGRPVADDRR